MRPPSEVRQALLKAAADLTTPGRSPTLRELATEAKVGQTTARHVVNHMKRIGLLRIVRERVVDYRNRPVSEYAPASPRVEGGQLGADLGNVLAAWGAAA